MVQYVSVECVCQFNPVGEPSVELAIRGDGSIILWLAISKTNVVLFETFFYVYVNMFVGFSTLKDCVLSSGTVEPLR